MRTKLSVKPALAFVVIFGLLGGYILWHSLAATSPVCDLNNDGTVNVFDLSILLNDYNTTNAAADCNGDGTVNVFDLSILLNNYGKSTSTNTPELATDDAAKPFPLSIFPIFSQKLAPDAPLNASSATWVTNLQAQAHWPSGGNGGAYAGFNTSGCDHPLYVIGPDVPLTRVYVRLTYTSGGQHVTEDVALTDPNFTTSNGISGVDLARTFYKGVPLPSGWKPTNCSVDHNVAVYQPSTGRYWDLESVHQSDANTGGYPSVAWGGYMPDANNTTYGSVNPGYFRTLNYTGHADEWNTWGGSATSIPYAAGMITKEDMLAGSINHAITIAVGQASCSTSLWPAQRHDCISSSTPVPEGAWFRLPANVDVNAAVANLNVSGLTPAQAAQAQTLERMLITAIRDYGMVVTDQTGGGVTLYFRDYYITSPTGAVADQLVKWGDYFPGYATEPWYRYWTAIPVDQLQVVQKP